MARITVRPHRYRLATMAAMVFLYLIVITGALVRLTGSGLGCSDWPNCNDNRFVDVSSKHAAIEQINRLFTGAVGAAVAIAVLGAVFRSPRRRDLTRLSIGLVAGVAGQAILGAFVVWSHLNPVAVQGHFLLSMVLMANALVLHRRAGQPDDGVRVATVSPRTAIGSRLVTVATAVALVTGTVVTGTGPHSGSVDGEAVRRFGFDIRSVVQVHSLAVWVTVASLLALAWRIRNDPDRRTMERAMWVFLGLAVTQGAVGYIQYFSDVPVVLVAVHITLATAVWLAAVWLWMIPTDVVAPVEVSSVEIPPERQPTLS